MTKLGEIYKCSVCGNVVEMLHASMGELVCCGQKMGLMEENTQDAAEEKHVPVVEISGNNVTVKVGEVAHPMEKEHWIERIELLKDGHVIAAKTLMSGEEPQAEFCLENTEGLTARELCNVHGLWKQ